jgi:hypothetical protein
LVRDGHQRAVEGTRLPGIALVVLWAGSIAVAWRARARKLLWLDSVLAVALATGLFSASRIVGDIWFYLFLWAWAIVALMLFTIGWAAVEYARTRVHDPHKWAERGTAALVGVIAVATLFFAIDAARVTVMTPRLNREMSEVIPPTIARLDSMRPLGERGPYRVTWLPDVQGIGAQGYSLLDEMLRHGFDARADAPNTPGATQYHVLKNPSDARLQVHLATGADIANYQRDSRFTQIAYSDPRTDAERAQFNRLHAQVVASLRQSNPDDVAQIDNNLFMLALSPNVPAATRIQISQMLDLTEPAAIFIGPADVDIP